MQSIFDHIVGFVKLSDAEESIYHHPIFSRLAKIRQLGLACNVFPGADHTRLSHSLGTTHFADRVAMSMMAAQTIERSELLGFVKETRLAAILHDIGHTPLSHTLERLFMSQYQRETLTSLSTDGSSEALASHPVAREVEDTYPSSGGPFHNSMMSAFLVENSSLAPILKSAGCDPEVISQLIAGRHERECYNQILDGAMDADKLDYLQRDRHGTGVAFGTVDVEQILRNLTLFNDVMCVMEDGAQASLHFLFVRYFWYTQIIHNKNVEIFEEMARRIYPCLTSNGLMPSAPEVLDLFQGIQDGKRKKEAEWCDFDDSEFFHAMAAATVLPAGKFKKSEEIDRATFSQFANHIRNRVQLPCVVRIDSVETPSYAAGDRTTWIRQHPRSAAFNAFRAEIEEDFSDEIRASRVILTSDRIPLLKHPDEERPIYVKTEHDKTELPLQQHYYSAILPMIAGGLQPLFFSTNRVYSLPELKEKLRRVWKRCVDEHPEE